MEPGAGPADPLQPFAAESSSLPLVGFHKASHSQRELRPQGVERFAVQAGGDHPLDLPPHVTQYAGVATVPEEGQQRCHVVCAHGSGVLDLHDAVALLWKRLTEFLQAAHPTG